MNPYESLKSAAMASPNAAQELLKLYDTLEGQRREILAFISRRDALTIHHACKGIGKDDETLIMIICNRTKCQLQAADNFYRSMDINTSQKTLVEKLKSELGGNYGHFMRYLCESRDNFNAHMLRKAMDGIGCSTDIVNEVMCTATTAELRGMKAAFENKADSGLVDRLRSELSGNHETLILNLLVTGRGDGPVDQTKAAAQADDLFNTIKNGGGMLSGLKDSAEKRVIEIIQQASPAQCQAIKAAYERNHPGQKSLDAMIDSKCSGPLKEALHFMLKDPLDVLCSRLKEATDGIGCTEETVSRIIGGNEKNVVQEIARRYKAKYDVELTALVKKETGGDYCNALTTWLAGVDPTGGYPDTPPPPPTAAMPPAEICRRIDSLVATIERMKEWTASLDADLVCTSN